MGVMRFADGKWKEAGISPTSPLQLNSLHMLEV
jgi:hypothetical protein